MTLKPQLRNLLQFNEGHHTHLTQNAISILGKNILNAGISCK